MSLGTIVLLALAMFWAVSVGTVFGLFVDAEWQDRRERRRLEEMWAMPTVDEPNV